MKNRLIPLLVIFITSVFFSASLLAEVGVGVRIMTFNLWLGGEAGGQPLAKSVEVIRAARADVVGLQETQGSIREGKRLDAGAMLASALGWHYFNQGGSPGILSRWPIVDQTPGSHGVTVQHPSGLKFHVFNVHLPAAPYQPYQLLNIPYHNAPFLKTADEAVEAARQARGRPVGKLITELRPRLLEGPAVFLTGDFNEPSHLDWTERAAKAGLCPLPVAYPTTHAIIEAGLKDAYRTCHQDEVAQPGWTWTPITLPDDPKDRHDRIDMVFFSGSGVEVESCEVVGEAQAVADIVVQPFPSDHRAVVASFKLAPTNHPND